MNLPCVQLCTVFLSVYFGLSIYFLSSKLSHHNISFPFERSASPALCLSKIFPSFNVAFAFPGPVFTTHKLAEITGLSACYFEKQHCSSSVPVPRCAGQCAGCQNFPDFLQMLCKPAHLPGPGRNRHCGGGRSQVPPFLAPVPLLWPPEEAGR